MESCTEGFCQPCSAVLDTLHLECALRAHTLDSTAAAAHDNICQCPIAFVACAAPVLQHMPRPFY